MEHQKASNRIYHVPQEETKREVKGKRMFRGLLSSKIQPRIAIKFTHYNIMFSRRFLCDESNELHLQTKECDWMRRWFHSQQVDVVWYTSMWHVFALMDDITGIGWLHWHGKNYWAYTWQCICTVCVMKDSIGSMTSYFHTSMVVYPGSNGHLQIHNLIHGHMLSSLSKKQQNGKVSLNNGILGIDYKC